MNQHVIDYIKTAGKELDGMFIYNHIGALGLMKGMKEYYKLMGDEIALIISYQLEYSAVSDFDPCLNNVTKKGNSND